MMKKLVLLLMVVMLIVPNVLVLAQDAPVTAQLEEFATNLPQGYGVTSVSDLLVMLTEQEPVLLDVREPAEYEAGHIDGSFNVPLRTVADNLDLLPDTDALIVVICKGGARAMQASTALQLLGYSNVKVLAGGFDAWAGEELGSTTEAFVPEAGAAPEFEPAILAAVSDYLSTLPEGFGLVSAANLNAELVEDAPILIDVRSEQEWNEQGYIEGAQLIPITSFWASQEQWPADKDAKIVVYCGSAYRGAIAAVLMNLMGYTDVRNLNGGLTAWKAAQLPVAGVPEVAEAAAEIDLNSALADYVASLPASFNAIRSADLAAMLEAEDAPLVVDVRTADEYAEGHVEGSVHIPLNELTDSLHLLPDLDAEIAVVCGSGHRSAIAMTALNLLGYDNATSMMSGLGAVTGDVLPMTQAATDYSGGSAPEVDPALLEQLDAYINAIPAGYYTVKSQDLGAELIENPPVLIDVRTDSEWANGFIEGAQHLELRDFFADPTAWPEDTSAAIVVYDNPTHRSSMTLTFLRLLGYENVRALGGGVGAWTNAGLPLVTE